MGDKMIAVSEFSKKEFKLGKNQLKELNKFLYFLNTKKNLKNPNLKLIDRKSFSDYKLYTKKPLYYQLNKSLLVYVD